MNDEKPYPVTPEMRSDPRIPEGWDFDVYGPPLGYRKGDFVFEPCMSGDQNAWKAELRPNQYGAPKNSVFNARMVLTHDTAWQGVLALDERTLTVMCLQPPPYQKKGSQSARALKDSDAINLCTWLDEVYGFTIGDTQAHKLMCSVAEVNSFNRVREYLHAVTWDGVERISLFLPVYFGAADNDYTRAIGRRWLISAVARALEPGCKADHVLVIEGDQGTGKSSAVAALCPHKAWFGDNIPPIHNKDAQQYIAGMWLIELAEMDAANKADQSTLKSFLTNDIDRYRPSYGRNIVDQPRACVFAGTVNHKEYLKDETGGRRFWCFESTKINVSGIRCDRDQLWAEAVHAYSQGEPWWLDTDELVEAAKAEQAQRFDEDPWTSTIDEWLGGRTQSTTSEIFKGALEGEIGKATQLTKNRIGRVMRSLGWSYQRGPRPTRHKMWKKRVPEPLLQGPTLGPEVFE